MIVINPLLTTPSMSAVAFLAQTEASAPPAAPAGGQPVQPAGMPGAPVVATPGGTTGAPGTAGTGASASPFGAMGIMLPVILLFGGLMVFQMFAGRKEKKKREELMASMKKGDKVQTYGGIVGTITEINDQEIVLRVEEGRIRFSRSAVQTVLGNGRGASGVEPKDARAESRQIEEPVNA